jgi:hypothetical protein
VTGLTDVIGHKSAPDYTLLTTDQQAELIAHGIASWMTGEHDGHAEQYLIKGGKLIRIDLGQALKYTLGAGDKLDLDYHPNAMYGEARPAHLQLLQAIKDGKVDAAVLHHPKVKAAAEKASKLSKAAITHALGGYGDLRPGGKSKEEIAALLKKRSESVKQDWADLFADVTGQTFDWDASAKPKKQRKSRAPRAQGTVRSAPTALDTGVDLPKLRPALETTGATTVLADGDKLRGQSWRIQRTDMVARVGVEASYTVAGELDQSLWAGLEQAIRSKGGKAKHWESYARVGLFDTLRDTANLPVKQFDLVKSTNFLGDALVYEDPDFEYRVTFAGSSSKTAMQGKIKIETFTADPAEAQRLMSKALTDLKLDHHKLDAKPTADSTFLARANRALWNLDGGAYQPARTVEEATDRLKVHGVEEKTLIARQNSLGYEEPLISGRWKGFRKDGVRFLYHQFGPREEAVRGITGGDGGKGGILSTVARTENGVIISGMSSSEDLNTGGASSTFTRLVGAKGSQAGKSWYSDFNYTAVISPQVLDRTDWYGYNYDNYGRVTGSAFTSRDGSVEHIKTVTERGSDSNEIMFRNAVAREDILLFAVANDSQRNNMLATLAASGVKTIRGQPVDEMVVVMKRPNDYTRLNARNPVHSFLMGKRETCPEWTETYGGTE